MENLDLKKITLKEAVQLTKAYRASRKTVESQAFFIPLNVLEKFLVVPEVKGIHIYIGEGYGPDKKTAHQLILVPTKFRDLNKDEQFEKSALFGAGESDSADNANIATEDILFYAYAINGGKQSDNIETVYASGPHPPPPNTRNALNS
ncbi:hypothetical protein I5907_11680 [Panacibacter sp. DH6]|uniref:Uncharacterized protein n=1 Tax=Panacibacter microcysteis TaxID=2793269 RepID=A0A931GUQ2_9BACT|nr:hypothetical protein [Panacibacter microcysteis]MBG9376901.1 hypothetical protein [Panacibacter microcysteis]